MKNAPAVGIDVGGTKTRCLLVDKNFQILEEIKFKTDPHSGRTAFTQNLQEAVRRLAQIAQNHKFEIQNIGVGCAGSVDHQKLRIKISPNLWCLEDYPIGKYLQQVLPVKIVIGNDLQLGIYAEHRLGVAAGLANVLGVFLGTGIGGAAIINHQLYFGASGMGGQVGNLLAQPLGGPKAALSHGILDRIGSKTAIAGEAMSLVAKNRAPYLHKKVGTDFSKVGWGSLRKAIEHGDSNVEEMLRTRLRVVGMTLANAVNFMNPQMLVLGGGLLETMPNLALEAIESGLREYLVPEVGKALKVKAAKLKGAAVAVGAALKAAEAKGEV